MKIQESRHGPVAVLAIEGRIDTTTSGAVEESFARLDDQGVRALLVDLGRVEYISSAGLRVLLVAAKRMREVRGRLVLCGLTDPVRQVFELAGFLPLFAVEATRDAALARLAAPA
jgi:anti-anti-sigma factor